MTYTLRATPMMDFTCDGLDDYAIVGHGRYAMSRDEGGGRWQVRRLDANYTGGAEVITSNASIITALEVLVRSVGEPETIVFDPAEHLLDPETVAEIDADDSPVMPAWVAQRVLYDADEFEAHWRNWAACVVDADDRIDEGSLVERVSWKQIRIARPDGTEAALAHEQAVRADFVIRRVPNAIALIADPANTPAAEPESVVIDAPDRFRQNGSTLTPDP